jgi:hypothetical protein
MAQVRRPAGKSRFPKLNMVRAMSGLPPLPDDYPERCRLIGHHDDETDHETAESEEMD